MNFFSVIDTSAFIWDKNKFDQNAAPFYELAGQLTTFIEVIERENPKILMRSQLINEMLIEFPWDKINGVPNFRDFSNVVYPFLATLSHRIIEFEGLSIDGIVSNPDIVYKYYSGNVKNELNFLITKIHTDAGESVYFTFLPIWVDTQTQLETKNGKLKSRIHTTVIHSNDELRVFFDGFKPVFKHSPKHDIFIRQSDKERGFKLVNEEEIYQLSCHNPNDNSVAQSLLSSAIVSPIEPAKLFNYDDVNNTFVCFVHTEDNIYHGYDQPIGRVHESIKKQFFKK